MNIKKKYMTERLDRLNKDKRNLLAKREIDTAEYLLEKFYNIDFKRFNSIVDYGCGDRFLESEIIKRGSYYTGYDINDFDFNKDVPPLENNSTDFVISLAVIEHLYNPEKLLNESYRILKPGGCIYLTTPNWQFDSKNFYNDYTHVNPFTPKKLEMILNDIGFFNISTYPGLRCKHKWFYQGKSRFHKAYYLFPFSGYNKFVPEILKGHARSIIGIGFKK